MCTARVYTSVRPLHQVRRHLPPTSNGSRLTVQKVAPGSPWTGIPFVIKISHESLSPLLFSSLSHSLALYFTLFRSPLVSSILFFSYWLSLFFSGSSYLSYWFSLTLSSSLWLSLALSGAIKISNLFGSPWIFLDLLLSLALSSLPYLSWSLPSSPYLYPSLSLFSQFLSTSLYFSLFFSIFLSFPSSSVHLPLHHPPFIQQNDEQRLEAKRDSRHNHTLHSEPLLKIRLALLPRKDRFRSVSHRREARSSTSSLRRPATRLSFAFARVEIYALQKIPIGQIINAGEWAYILELHRSFLWAVISRICGLIDCEIIELKVNRGSTVYCGYDFNEDWSSNNWCHLISDLVSFS